MSDSGKRRKRQVHRLEDLEVSSISLVDRPAIDIEFLVLKRYDPEAEEGPMAKKNEDELEPQAKADEPAEEEEEVAVETPAASEDEAPAEAKPDEKSEFEPESGVVVLKAGKWVGGENTGLLKQTRDAIEKFEAFISRTKVTDLALTADFRAAVQTLLDHTERALKQESQTTEGHIDYGPTDFTEAWVEVETEDTLWKALSIFNRVVTAIYESVEGDKVGMLVKAVDDFASRVKGMMGAIKEEPSAEEATGEEAPTSDESDMQVLARAVTDLSQAFGDEMSAMKGQVAELEKRLAGEAPEPEASTEGDAAEETEKPVTLADVQKAIAAAIAKAKQPQYKGLLPEPEETKDEEVPMVRTAKERAQTLRELNERLQGVK